MTVGYADRRWTCHADRPDERLLTNGMTMRRLRRMGKKSTYWVECSNERISAVYGSASNTAKKMGWAWSGKSDGCNEKGLKPHPAHVVQPPMSRIVDDVWGPDADRLLPTVSLQLVDSAAALLRQIKTQVPRTGWACIEIPNGPLLDLIESLQRGRPAPTRRHRCPWADCEPLRFVASDDDDWSNRCLASLSATDGGAGGGPATEEIASGSSFAPPASAPANLRSGRVGNAESADDCRPAGTLFFGGGLG